MSEYTHAVFGPLSWDEERECWAGTAKVGNISTTLSLITEGKTDIPDEFVQMYHLLLPTLPLLYAGAVSWVISDLSHWLEEDEDRSAEALSAQMQVSDVEIYAGDGASVWFHGPNTIYDSGHFIEARIGTNAKLEYFCLNG